MKKFDYIKDFSVEEVARLKSNSKYIEVPKNTLLFYQDDVCEDILFLEEGEVRLYMSGNLNEEIPLYNLVAGEQCIINTSSVLSKTKTIGSAETLTDIKGWLVPKRVIEELISNNKEYQSFVFSLFALRFNSLITLVEDIKFKKLDSRILDFLHKQKSKLITITHEELALELGTSRVVVSRVLKDLEHKKYIHLHRGKIEILM